MDKPNDVTQELFDEMMKYGTRALDEIPENALTVKKAMEIWNIGESGARRRLRRMVEAGTLTVRKNVPISGTLASVNLYEFVEK